MTNCNDCLHEEVCDISSRQMWSIMAGEKECTDFKERTKYAEVVRCKDCKYQNEYGDCDIHDEWSTRKPDSFCCYGERKDNGN